MVISIANQKGGAQKSTLTSLFATAIHYGMVKHKVAVIDVDLQASLYRSRAKELEAVMRSETEKKKLEALTEKRGSPLYPIFKCNHQDLRNKIMELEGEGYTIIFLDLPGTLEASGLDIIYPLIHFLFIPCYTDLKSQDSTAQFIKKINLILKGNQIENNLIDYAVFFTKYTTNSKLKDYDKFNTIRTSFNAVGINILENGFHESKVFSDNFPWTVMPTMIDARMQKINPQPLFMEMFTFIKSKTTK